jgi:ABC-type uncharacterized transport system substrate-binding protein
MDAEPHRVDGRTPSRTALPPGVRTDTCFSIGRRRLLPLLLLLCGWLSGPSVAADGSIAVFASGPGEAYAEAIGALTAEMRKAPGTRIVVGTAGVDRVDDMLAGAGQTAAGSGLLIVTIGAAATRSVLEHGDLRTPVLAMLIPRVTFEALQRAARSPQGRRAAAVFLDQPLARQFDLLRVALPKARRVGAITGPDSGIDPERLRATADARQFVLSLESVERETELYPALERVLTDADAFLAIPDAKVVNSATAQNVLLTSFRFRVPVVGYSAAYVRAGALLAVYSTPAQIGAEAGALARAVVGGAALPAPNHPRHFSVAVNRQVARSLGLAVEDDAVLRDRLLRIERE